MKLNLSEEQIRRIEKWLESSYAKKMRDCPFGTWIWASPLESYQDVDPNSCTYCYVVFPEHDLVSCPCGSNEPSEVTKRIKKQLLIEKGASR